MVIPPPNVVAEKEGRAASAWQAEQQHACTLYSFIVGEWVSQAYMHNCSVTTFNVSLASLDPSNRISPVQVDCPVPSTQYFIIVLAADAATASVASKEMVSKSLTDGPNRWRYLAQINRLT